MKRKILMCIVGLLFLYCPCQAQHSIDIQRLAAAGDYYRALQVYLELPKRRITTEATLAAAKAAWGLSLPAQAISYFELALTDQTLSDSDRARINLARGIVEYQEERYQVATVYAERAANLLPAPAPLRGRIWELWADSLVKQKLYGLAEEKYLKAVKELDVNDVPDVSFRLGVCRSTLGKYDLARQAFEQVPLNHPLASEAVRNLALVALRLDRYEQAGFWFKTGRDKFPESFLDSWVDYEQIRIAIKSRDDESIKQLLELAEERHPPSDYWLTLAQGAAVAYQWQNLAKKGVAENAGK